MPLATTTTTMGTTTTRTQRAKDNQQTPTIKTRTTRTAQRAPTVILLRQPQYNTQHRLCYRFRMLCCLCCLPLKFQQTIKQLKLPIIGFLLLMCSACKYTTHISWLSNWDRNLSFRPPFILIHFHSSSKTHNIQTMRDHNKRWAPYAFHARYK